jgi:hypothetical protein
MKNLIEKFTCYSKLTTIQGVKKQKAFVESFLNDLSSELKYRGFNIQISDNEIFYFKKRTGPIIISNYFRNINEGKVLLIFDQQNIIVNHRVDLTLFIVNLIILALKFIVFCLFADISNYLLIISIYILFGLVGFIYIKHRSDSLISDCIKLIVRCYM